MTGGRDGIVLNRAGLCLLLGSNSEKQADHASCFKRSFILTTDLVVVGAVASNAKDAGYRTH